MAFHRSGRLLNLARPLLAALCFCGATATEFLVAADPAADIVSPPMSPEESLRAMVVRPGFRVELVAHEPLVVDPVALAWGADARLWVVEMNDYPLGLDGKGKPGGRVKILQDDDGDGRYDRGTLFLEGLQYPTSVLPWRDGALVCAVPEIFFARDTDGDGRADERRTLYTGLHVGNPQHLANGLRYGLDGWVHCANGATKTAVKSVQTGKSVEVGTRDFAVRPDTGDIEPLAGRSQYLRECDDWGNWFGNANSNPMFHFVLEDRYLRRNPHATYPLVQHDISVTPGAAQVFPVSRTVTRFNDLSRANRFTSACSATIYRDEFLGRGFYGNSFVCEPVHNLVHREILTPDGATFTSRKPEDEARSEFLASRDNWFRPAMVRTGPDGALWIADMYRLVIEHPEWIPKEWQAKLDLRAGSDRGRIYRVFPAELKPWAIPKLADLGPAELAEKLAGPNGTVRDLAMQLLVERYTGQKARTPEVGQAVDALNKVFRESSRPATRLQALCTLALLDDELDTLLLRQALADEHPGVRRGALRLVNAEFLALDKHLLPAVLKTADDPDAAVRLQAACALGDVHVAEAAAALGRVAAANVDDPYLAAAVQSSLRADNIVSAVRTAVAAAVQQRKPATPLIHLFADSAAGYGAPQALSDLVQAALAAPEKADRVGAVAVLLDSLARHRYTLDKLRQVADSEFSGRLATLELLLNETRAAVGNERTPVAERLAALALLGREPARQADDLALLAKLLTPQTSDALQTAAIASLAKFSAPEAADLLLDRWKTLAPARKSQALDACLARNAWAEKLVAAVAAKRVPAAEIDVTRSQQLLHHSNKALREKATQALAASVNVDRRRVIDEYQSALTLAGDPARGREAFTKSCANCHKLGELGHAVGPDLAALSDKRPATLLASVLDPNKAVESKYLAYIAETTAGLTFTGVLIAESTNDVTLALADGKRQTILRSELDSFVSTAKSFMPEGLEKDLPPQKLADVLAFVAATRPVRKTFAGNAPQVVRPEALRGEFYLLPEHAEIYGGTLIFEPKFSNLGYWRSENDRAEWELEVVRPGLYDVWLEYACPDDAGGAWVLESGESRLRGTSASTGSWERYRTVVAGQMQLAAGRQRFVVHGDGAPKGALFDLKSLRVKPHD